MARTGCTGRDLRSRAGLLAGALALGAALAWCPPAGGAPRISIPKTRILGVRHFSTTGYARLVLVLDRETFDFESGRLQAPPRIFIDIPRGELRRGAGLPSFRAGEGLIRQLRVGRHGSGGLRLVVDLSRPGVRHRIFTLPEPHRIVLDLRAAPPARPIARGGAAPRRTKESLTKRIEESRGAPPPARPAPPAGRGGGRRGMDLAARFRNGLGRVVLDPGHGGKDPGTTGLYGVVEKDFVLDIAFRAARVLRRRLPGNRVILTRTTDRYLPLSERTSIANDNEADVFVSIHANSAPHHRTRGIETYLLSEASSSRALELAARESETTVARLTDLQKILNDLMLRSKVTESQQLADAVHGSMLSQIVRRHPRVKDLGVKRGPFYVLVGAQMPSILIETSFLSNPLEARWARSPRYRQAIAEGIVEGIARFVGVPTRRAGRPRGPLRRARAASP